MLEWLMNFGTGLPAWTMFFVTAICIACVVWFMLAVWRMLPVISDGTDKWKVHLKGVIVKGVFLALVLFTALAAFGPGTPSQELPSDIGAMEYVDKAPDMKTQAEIDAEAEAKVSRFLKEQDKGFKAYQEEADAYLDNVRKKYQNR